MWHHVGQLFAARILLRPVGWSEEERCVACGARVRVSVCDANDRYRTGVGRDLGEEGFKAYLETKQVVTYLSSEPWGWYNKSK